MRKVERKATPEYDAAAGLRHATDTAMLSTGQWDLFPVLLDWERPENETAQEGKGATQKTNETGMNPV